MIKASAGRFVAIAGVLAASAAVLAGGPAEPRRATIDDAVALCRSISGAAEPGAATCVIRIDPTPAPRSPSSGQAVGVPLPIRLATNGLSGCVRGPARPVLDTVGPTLAVTFAAAGPTPAEATFEQAPLDGSEQSSLGTVPVAAGRQAVLEPDTELVPGRSYRWRVRGTAEDATVPGWSDWCEFTVRSGLADLIEADDTTIRELGLEPRRRYPVTLTVREWRLVLDGLLPDDGGDRTPADGEFITQYQIEARKRDRRIDADIRARIAGRAAGRPAIVVLRGYEWASVASSVASSAAAWEQADDDGPAAAAEERKTWHLLDRISAQLGGPAHPSLGLDRPVTAR
ncbi:hypothetical protein ODJ79_30300 [Actinoplanes sp. KI2]|uniref:hypothetical protein n=1 Tax=Actinoplanes sp. KI2 TaxID=2983315 RepID=UPI0021D585C2|nr:hypothetical protein [Actinoplanes sp. KI2]MCU7728030.1 hypothetical protein [Actinoplanes sp. KI2]